MTIMILNNIYDNLSSLNYLPIDKIEYTRLNGLNLNNNFNIAKYKKYNISFFLVNSGIKLILPNNGTVFGYDLISNINIYLYNKYIIHYKIKSVPIFNYNNCFTCFHKLDNKNNTILFNSINDKKSIYIKKPEFVESFFKNKLITLKKETTYIDNKMKLDINNENKQQQISPNLMIIEANRNNNESSSSNDYSNLNNNNDVPVQSSLIRTEEDINNYKSSSLNDFFFLSTKDLNKGDKFETRIIAYFFKKDKIELYTKIDFESILINNKSFTVSYLPKFKVIDLKLFFLVKKYTNNNPLTLILLKLNHDNPNSRFILKFCDLIYKNEYIDLVFYINLFYKKNRENTNPDYLKVWDQLFEKSILKDYEIKYYFNDNNNPLVNYNENVLIYKPNEILDFIEDYENNNQNSNENKKIYNRLFLVTTLKILTEFYNSSRVLNS